MIGDLVLGNAMWWGQFRLMGGAGKVAARTGVYAGLVLAAFLVACQLSKPTPIGTVANKALYFVGFAQLIFILPWWGSRIHKAVLTDRNVNMIESHRLSPTTGLSAVAGYLIGPGLQVACLCGVNLIAGIVLCLLANKLLVTWVAGHVFLLFAAVFAWSGTLLASLCLGKQANLITALFVLLFMGAWRIVEAVPGLGLICGAELIGYCHRVATGGGAGSFPPGASLSVVVQIGVILAWLRGAAGKFERPDLPAFSVLGASLLYVGWLVVAVVGLERADALRLPALGFQVEAKWQLASTLILSACLLILPLRSAAFSSQRWLDQHRELAGERPPAPLLVGLLLSAATAALVAALPAWSPLEGWALPNNIWFSDAFLWTVASLLLTGVSLAALYRAAYALRLKTVDLPTMLYVVVIWIIPPVADSILLAYREASAPAVYEAEMTWLTGCSPVGGIITAWASGPAIAWEGLVFQAALCLVLLVWEHRAVRVAKARRAATGGTVGHYPPPTRS
jgi:hypothetical protein